MEHKQHICNDEYCVCCNGKLTWCVVCQGAEASMPTDCPGRLLTDIEIDAIMGNTLDFVDGEWIFKAITHGKDCFCSRCESTRDDENILKTC